MQTTLLIDSDILAYNSASRGEIRVDWGDGEIDRIPEDVDDAIENADRTIRSLVRKLRADDVIVCLSCDRRDNFRKDVYPLYKENRAGAVKPVHLVAVKQHLREHYECYERPRLEADDVMGILSTHPRLIPGKKIIVSQDKDMQTVPGWLFNPDKDRAPREISEQEADRWFFYQTLVGDPTDGYPGCPGVGPVKASRVLDDRSSWDAVVDTFAKALERKTRYATAQNTPSVRAGYEMGGYELRGPVPRTEAEAAALVQARLARILRWTDYDYTTKKPILWTP